jgi:hypothetical protein
MCLGAMLGNGGGAVARVIAGMAGHANAAVKDFYRGGGGAHYSGPQNSDQAIS